MPGVRWKPNASWLNDCQFMVVMVKACRKEAKKRPITPPTRASRIDSIRNAARIERRRKPRARSVPISPVRFETDAYMVIIAPIIAPMEKITDSMMPSQLMNAGELLRLLLRRRSGSGFTSRMRRWSPPMRRLEGVELAGVLQPRDGGRVRRAPERLHHLLDVAPHLGVVARLAAVEVCRRWSTRARRSAASRRCPRHRSRRPRPCPRRSPRSRGGTCARRSIFTCGRIVSPIGGIPRTTRFAGLSLPRFGIAMRTSVSLETSGSPSAPRATSGRVSMSEAWSRYTALCTSVCADWRSRIALS